MLKKQTLDKLRAIGQKTVDTYKDDLLELVDVEFVKEAGNWYLRYYIDKPGGVTLNDCEKISQDISRQLDIIDPIPYSYSLEVSSPGIERPLKNERDFLKALNKLVEIKTYEPIDGKKVFTGTLKGYSGDILTINDGKEIKIPKQKIASVRLKFLWNGE